MTNDVLGVRPFLLRFARPLSEDLARHSNEPHPQVETASSGNSTGCPMAGVQLSTKITRVQHESTDEE